MNKIIVFNSKLQTVKHIFVKYSENQTKIEKVVKQISLKINIIVLKDQWIFVKVSEIQRHKAGHGRIRTYCPQNYYLYRKILKVIIITIIKLLLFCYVLALFQTLNTFDILSNSLNKPSQVSTITIYILQVTLQE